MYLISNVGTVTQPGPWWAERRNVILKSTSFHGDTQPAVSVQLLQYLTVSCCKESWRSRLCPFQSQSQASKQSSLYSLALILFPFLEQVLQISCLFFLLGFWFLTQVQVGTQQIFEEWMEREKVNASSGFFWVLLWDFWRREASKSARVQVTRVHSLASGSGLSTDPSYLVCSGVSGLVRLCLTA